MSSDSFLRSLVRPVLNLGRRALDTDGLHDRITELEGRLADHARRNAQSLAAIQAAMAGLGLPADEVRETAIGRRARRLIELLAPIDIADGTFVRVGRAHDGGYVMLDDFSALTTAYSFGIAKDVSWETDVAGRGIDIHMYDHTIESLPAENARFHFSRQGVTGRGETEKLATLPRLIKENGHANREDMLLKMDVEGCEWDVLNCCPQSTLQAFKQIVIEFHDLVPAASGGNYDAIERALERLGATHACVHIHANVYEPSLILPGLVLPSAVECTYVRRSDYEGRIRPCTRVFPLDLDQSCDASRCDLPLGRMSAPE